MNIMIFDVPAVRDGALSILKEFYSDALQNKDKNIKWFFVVSQPNLEEKENIKVLKYPWVKKSWLHRLYFDHCVAHKLIKNYKIDKIISLQNVIVPHTNIHQTLYVHQSLPFSEYKFKFRENKLFWIYQNIIGKMIKKSIKKSKEVIVQTECMKNAFVDQINIDGNKIKVIPPKINLDIKKSFNMNKESMTTFFYPANGSSYKNHRIIIIACKKLKEKNIQNYKIIFTLKGNENENIIDCYKEVIDNSLPIDFIGSISREQVFELYTKSILIFPSYIETFGLPLLEARLHKGIILASDCCFSREVLNDYKNAYYFNPFESSEITKLLEDIISRYSII